MRIGRANVGTMRCAKSCPRPVPICVPAASGTVPCGREKSLDAGQKDCYDAIDELLNELTHEPRDKGVSVHGETEAKGTRGNTRRSVISDGRGNAWL